MASYLQKIADSATRRSFIGGSDARIIMGSDEAALTAVDAKIVEERFQGKAFHDQRWRGPGRHEPCQCAP